MSLGRLAVQAHIRGALDFNSVSRYDPLDIIRKSLVYNELSRETGERAWAYLTLRHALFVPVAKDRAKANEKVSDNLTALIDRLYGRTGSAERGKESDFIKMWENYWGIDINSPEWEAEQRRIIMGIKQQETERKRKRR